MGLEAVMICVDNSDYTRNGDYNPTRFAAQSEAVQYLANAKLQEHQESSVGILSMAGTRIEVHISPGRAQGQILNALAKEVKVGGTSNFLAGLKTAQLALKNRQNKNQKQRIIMFVASPLQDVDGTELVKLGKIFKKNNVAVDVVNFGTENSSNSNTEKLEALIAAVNTSDNSHLLNIPPGPHILSDLILTSAICMEGGRVAPGVSMGGNGGAVGAAGAMEDMDPEMAEAIRLSMEEEKQRQQKAATDTGAAATATSNAANAGMEDDDDALLAQAIAMSMAAAQDAAMSDATNNNSATPSASSVATTTSSSAPSSSTTTTSTSQPSAADINAAMEDPDFINSLLASVPGADGQVDNLLDELTKNEKKDNEGDKK